MRQEIPSRSSQDHEWNMWVVTQWGELYCVTFSGLRYIQISPVDEVKFREQTAETRLCKDT